MKNANYQMVSGTIFAIMAIGQLTRLIFQFPIHIGAFNVPVWLSAIAFIGALLMSIWAFRSAVK